VDVLFEATLVGEHERRARGRRSLRDGPGQGALIRDANDEADLAREIRHAALAFLAAASGAAGAVAMSATGTGMVAVVALPALAPMPARPPVAVRTLPVRISTKP